MDINDDYKLAILISIPLLIVIILLGLAIRFFNEHSKQNFERSDFK